jgi:hypothetical protein
MAVCLESSSSYKIVSKNDQKPDKSLFLVKLTDSCLKTLEQLQNPTAKSKVRIVYYLPYTSLDFYQYYVVFFEFILLLNWCSFGWF